MKQYGMMCGLAFWAAATFGQPVEVRVNPAIVRDIGGMTTFEREQFITVHESFGSIDMSDEDLRYLEETLEAKYGRDGGSLTWLGEGVPEDPNHPGMPDVSALKKKLRDWRVEYAGRRMTPANMKPVVLCTHPEFMFAREGNEFAPWAQTAEGVAEYTAQFLKHGFSEDERPRYLEVFNEPFVKVKKIPGSSVEAMSEQHNVVAQRVREVNPDVLVGGYSAAWVEVEDRNFEHWNNWQKTFMDIAGENMDFWSYHIYDGVNVEGSPRDRTGSNSEAIMDLIDSYSHLKFGIAKPQMITEYGKIPGGNMNSMPYSAERSAGMLYSVLGQTLVFMNHPDRYLRVIPFILGKATWTYGMTNDSVPGEANPFLLWRKAADGSFVETDLTLFYQFFKGVGGEWRASTSSNPDVVAHLLADGSRLNLLLMNLDKEARSLSLKGLDGVPAKTIQWRTLTTQGSKPVLGQRYMDGVPARLELEGGQAALLMIDLAQEIPVKGMVREHRVYATEYLKDIVAGEPIPFTFKNVPTGKGSARLRLSPGREKGKAVLPEYVKLNGRKLEVPTNWMGDDQVGRKNFFGMIEIPVPMDALQSTTRVDIGYMDDGGKIACAVLQVNQVK